MTETSPSFLSQHDGGSYLVDSFRLDGQRRFFLRYDGGAYPDGVFVDHRLQIQTFHSIEDALAFARSRGLSMYDADPPVQMLNGRPAMIDLDVITRWLHSPSGASLDCIAILDALNLFEDVSLTLAAAFSIKDPILDGVYDKLFWGSNLPTMTPDGDHYVPSWDEDEVRRLAEALARGLAIFRAHVKLAS